MRRIGLTLGLVWLVLGTLSVEAIKYETTAEKNPDPSESLRQYYELEGGS